MTHLDRHACAVKAHREQSALSQHTLEPSCELDLRYSESVSEMERAVHVGVWKRPEPFALFRGTWLRRVNFEDLFSSPSRLSLFL